jgi:hypothetical protein
MMMLGMLSCEVRSAAVRAALFIPGMLVLESGGNEIGRLSWPFVDEVALRTYRSGNLQALVRISDLLRH